MYLFWPGNALGSPRRNWRVWLGRRKPGGPCLGGCHRDPAPDKRTRMEGWMDGFLVSLYVSSKEKAPLETAAMPADDTEDEEEEGPLQGLCR